MHTLMLGQQLAIATAALTRAVYNHQCDHVLSNDSNYKHAEHLYVAYIDAGTTISDSYSSADKSICKNAERLYDAYIDARTTTIGSYRSVDKRLNKHTVQ
eukprot:8833-Heterococcus_DN1.PRE.1